MTLQNNFDTSKLLGYNSTLPCMSYTKAEVVCAKWIGCKGERSPVKTEYTGLKAGRLLKLSGGDMPPTLPKCARP